MDPGPVATPYLKTLSILNISWFDVVAPAASSMIKLADGVNFQVADVVSTLFCVIISILASLSSVILFSESNLISPAAADPVLVIVIALDAVKLNVEVCNAT